MRWSHSMRGSLPARDPAISRHRLYHDIPSPHYSLPRDVPSINRDRITRNLPPAGQAIDATGSSTAGAIKPIPHFENPRSITQLIAAPELTLQRRATPLVPGKEWN